MKFPKLSEQPTSRSITDEFAGYNHNLRIGDGEFYDEENMCSDDYPLLSVRCKRGVYATPTAPQGLIAKDSLCYVDGTKFVINDQRIEMNLSTAAEKCPKSLISMGAYVIIMPDKKYINTVEVKDRGSIEASFQSGSSVRFSLCTAEGDGVEAVASETAPEEPGNGAYWLDTSGEKHALKVYSSATNIWTTVATTYVKISATGIGAQFKQYDGVTIAGITKKSVKGLNGSAVIWSKANDYIVVVGLLDAAVEQTAEEGNVTVKRTMPDMDFVVESGNRLWGCRYGMTDGEAVNEIYASKLGDFRNWRCFEGLSTDSYAAARGSDGAFTGAVSYLGNPIFFKERCMERVYAGSQGAHQIVTTECSGVQKGSAKSLQVVGGVLYYLSDEGVLVFDGSLPVTVSQALGERRYSAGVGGAWREKYYLSALDEDGAASLLVYDSERKLWHREDDLRAVGFAVNGGVLYAMTGAGDILALKGGGTVQEEPVVWRAETGELGLDSSEGKYLVRLSLRLRPEEGSTVRAAVSYDEGQTWQEQGGVTGSGWLRDCVLHVRPRRCRRLRLRLYGVGGCRVYSLTAVYEKGSDGP